MTTRGMGDDGFRAVGALIADVLRGEGGHHPALQRRCLELASAHPIPAAFGGFDKMRKRSE
jgi:hypothetical protein